FVVAILIFAIGSGISIYEGIDKVLHPHPMSDPTINYIVLGLALLFDGIAWTVALREFQTTKGKKSYIEAVRDSKDPSVFTVLFEDTAAMLGLVVAFVGIAGSQYFGIAELDGVASIAIGIILGLTAVLLAYETKGLLIGEAAAPEIVKTIRNIVEATPVIDRLNEIRTLHFGPNDVLLAVSVDFEDNLTAGKVEDAIHDLEVAIKQRFPVVKRLFIEVQSAADHAEEVAKARELRAVEAGRADPE
ncbi:MAG: cation diffusion facilitator family transporter, partial [Nitratireductor sp.]|nr:cation diffusion facilitator family transporter [Nitratireductor sp.]